MIIRGGKTALVLGSPSADLRDDQRAFMKVRLRWFLLQRGCVIFGQPDQRRVAVVVCSALHYATVATARLHARQGNRTLQTMVQLFTCYMVCQLSQCLLKENAWQPDHQQSGVRLVGAARGREQSLKLQVGKTQRCGGQTPLRKVHLGLTKTIVTILVWLTIVTILLM